jgi:hypothetical protein
MKHIKTYDSNNIDQKAINVSINYKIRSRFFDNKSNLSKICELLTFNWTHRKTLNSIKKYIGKSITDNIQRILQPIVKWTNVFDYKLSVIYSPCTTGNVSTLGKLSFILHFENHEAELILFDKNNNFNEPLIIDSNLSYFNYEQKIEDIKNTFYCKHNGAFYISIIKYIKVEDLKKERIILTQNTGITEIINDNLKFLEPIYKERDCIEIISFSFKFHMKFALSIGMVHYVARAINNFDSSPHVIYEKKNYSELIKLLINIKLLHKECESHLDTTNLADLLEFTKMMDY